MTNRKEVIRHGYAVAINRFAVHVPKLVACGGTVWRWIYVRSDKNPNIWSGYTDEH